MMHFRFESAMLGLTNMEVAGLYTRYRSLVISYNSWADFWTAKTKMEDSNDV